MPLQLTRGTLVETFSVRLDQQGEDAQLHIQHRMTHSRGMFLSTADPLEALTRFVRFVLGLIELVTGHTVS
jgi:hypothetical protein